MPGITVGTDCSGMEAPIQALDNMGVKYSHLFSCDIDRHARATIQANFPPTMHLYEDITKRTSAPGVQLYVAGFPCQPFSSAGLQQGFSDAKGRGTIFWNVLEYIREHKPTVFILENVSGLVRINGGEYFRAIQEELRSLGLYNVYSSLLNTREHGVPHSRNRIYMVGICKDRDNGKFQFPGKIPLPDIEDFLDPRKPHEVFTTDPPANQGTALKNVQSARNRLVQEGKKPHQKAFIIDVDSSPLRSKSLEGVSPCITCSRRSGHWVSNRGRRLNLQEMMRLQGMDPSKFTVAVSPQQLGKQIGNAMSVNVLERLLVRILPAAGLVPRSHKLEDRWETGKALAVLKASRGHGVLSSFSSKALQSPKRTAAPLVMRRPRKGTPAALRSPRKRPTAAKQSPPAKRART